MRLRLVPGLILLALAAPAAAENWQPVPGEADTYVDSDFTRVDQQSGQVVLRTAIGEPSGATYAEWTDKAPVVISAVDCAAKTYKDLGIDMDGDDDVPADWRSRRSQPSMELAVGQAAVMACKDKDSLPVVALP